MHYNGHASVLDDDITAEQYGDGFQRYIGDRVQTVESYRFGRPCRDHRLAGQHPG